jgi:aldose 1-epimerase
VDRVIPLSGRQYEIEAGPYRAVIASIGGTLRSLTHEGRDLVVPFVADEVRPAFRGAVLAPWPNRVVDGRYSFGGIDHELPLTEPKRSHALHGLAAWLDFAEVTVAADAVSLATTIEAQIGYPYRLDLLVSYELDESGLHTTITATNTGPATAPFGTASHPYLVAGDGLVDDWTLEVPASEVQLVTADRLIPTDLVPVTPELDFLSARRIGDTEVDHAYTGIDFVDGSAEVRVTTEDGTGVAMSWDPSCPWVQIHTADRPDAPEISRIGLAVEPMTCPPDAFNSGLHLIELESGATTTTGWAIRAL